MSPEPSRAPASGGPPLGPAAWRLRRLAQLRSASMALKRGVGAAYRRCERAAVHALLERGLQSTWTGEASSGYLFMVRGLWGRRIGRGDTLLDYGSGRGRMLLAAARYPFGRVIGLELNGPECEVARANARIASPRLRCSQIEVVQADATRWPLPDEVTYIYMFNPFTGEIFDAVLAGVIESLERRPRPLTLIYANPTCASAVLATGRLERVRVSRGLRRNLAYQRIEVFNAIDPGARPAGDVGLSAQPDR